MISITLYGRNDSHGYNLHKRAAISLNAIAEILTGPTDEIIFVDYNTPDELPTFPEAIADTLTDRCKQLLRTLRVRPSYHQQFADKTRLAALESQSRNIAIRRSNPANRWVLSTNTDMIFCARSAASLTEALSDMPDGFYHLPRFEVPEGFWERLDRMDPKAAIQAMETNGVRFHLNELVFGAYDNIYEAPGDFQLFLRQDLFDIHGFDERMILGWHVDSNIARRMKLLRGEVKTAIDKVWGFHCGHTRQATPLHGGNRTENDSDVFVAQVDVPTIPSQADTWGAPDLEVEEIRLTAVDHYFSALAGAVEASGEEITAATYNDSSFGEVSYTPEHVLPHLCDLVFNLPAGSPMLFFGSDHKLLNGLADFLQEAGKRPDVILPDIPELIGDRAGWTALARVLPLEEALSAAELVILQYPSADMADAQARMRQEWLCQRMLFNLAEDAAGRRTLRRVVTVNGIHNGLTQPLDYLLRPTVMPFSTRIRQGFLGGTELSAAADRGPEQPIYQKLDRYLPFTSFDRQLLTRAAQGLAEGRPVEGWERLAPEIAAIAASPGIRRAFGVPDAAGAAVLESAANAMRDAMSKLAEPPVAVGPRLDVSNRLLSGSDWDSPEWLRTAAAFFNLDSLDYRGRTRWMWEHVALTVGLRHHLPTNPLAEGQAPKVLVVAEHPDPLAAVYAHMGYDVRYATATDVEQGKISDDWSSVLEDSSLAFPDTWPPYDPAEGLTFDAFVCPLPCLFERSAEEMDAILSALHPAMKAGALFLITAPVQINEVAYNGALGFAEWKVLFSDAGPLGMRGFQAVGEIDDRIPLDAAVRFAFEDNAQQTIRGYSYGYFASRMTSGVIAASWPETLRPGSPERIIWTPRTEGGWTVDAPYGTGPLKVTRAREPGRSGGLVLHAERALERTPPAMTSTVRNILAFAVTTCKSRRTPLEVTVEAESPDKQLGPWISISIDAGEAQSVVVQLDTDAVIIDAASVIHGLGEGPAEIRGHSVVALPRDGMLGRIGLAVRFEEPSVTIRAITAQAERQDADQTH